MLRSIILNGAPGTSHTYRIVAPLDRDWRLDPKEWLKNKDSCVVLRMRPSEDMKMGHLSLKIDASGRFMWFILYEDRFEDELCHRVTGPRFCNGDQVGVRDPSSGAMQSFQVSADCGCS